MLTLSLKLLAIGINKFLIKFLLSHPLMSVENFRLNFLKKHKNLISLPLHLLSSLLDFPFQNINFLIHVLILIQFHRIRPDRSLRRQHFFLQCSDLFFQNENPVFFLFLGHGTSTVILREGQLSR